MSDQTARTQRSAPGGVAMTLAHSADLSPDAASVAWCVSRIEGDEETLRLRLSRVGEDSYRTWGEGPRDHDPVWSPDGTKLAYLCDRGDQVELWLAEADSLACRSMMPADGSAPDLVSAPVWSPDGSHLAYAAVQSAPREEEPYWVTRTIPWVDGVGLVDDALADIFVVELATGRHRRLTKDDRVNHSPTWLGDSSALVFLASNAPDEWEDRSHVRRVGLDGVVVDVAGPDTYFSVASTAVGVVTSTLAEGPRDTPRLTVTHADGSTSDRLDGLELDLNGDVIADVAIPFVDPDPRLLIAGDDAVVRVQVQDRLEVHRVALTGPAGDEVLLSGPACYYPLAVRGRHLLYARGTIIDPPELWVVDLEGDHRLPVSNLAEENTGLCDDVSALDFWVRAAGGPPVQCKFLRRADLDGPLPTVLLIHGGPKSAFGQAFFHDAQLLCAAGFGVLMVNPRGSRGYGVDFADAISGEWGSPDYQDLMTAIDECVARELADPDRLGVSGLSYGGYMSAWIVSHTTRFRAAVIENPVTNLWSLYGTSDIGLCFGPEITGGAPQEVFERYVRSSPLTTAHTCTTPTLLVQGEQDHRCPPEQGLQFYSALKRVGCTVEMLMLPGASHAGSITGPVPARRAQDEALVDWMSHHVLG